MLRATLTALACLCAASASPASPANRSPSKKPLHPAAYPHTKSLAMVLESIDERLSVLEDLSLEQKLQSNRLTEIEKKMDLIEKVMSVRLEQAELSKHYLERRLHMLQSSIQDSLQFSGDRQEQSQKRVEAAALNITHGLQPYAKLFKEVDSGYREAAKRSTVLETLTRDGLALVNVTRRELADGLHGLARRQRDYRLTAKDIEAVVAEANNHVFKRLSAHTERLEEKVQKVLSAQERFLDSCPRIQRDERDELVDTQVTHLLDKLLDNIINKTNVTVHKLQAIQNEIRNHDSKMSRVLTTRNYSPNEAMLKRIESAVRNATAAAIRESELQKLTDKYIDLTNRADAALLLLESRLENRTPMEAADSDGSITSDADKLINKLQNLNSDEDDYDNYDEWYSHEDEQDDEQDMLTEDQTESWKPVTAKPTHRRHLHKHPYDRGPKKN